MEGLIVQKKREKRKALLDAAYVLFARDGISNTSISEICHNAGIAKGTFYLYFSSKEDIARALNRKISLLILQEAYNAVLENRKEVFEDNVITMADFIIDYFKKDKEPLMILKKDFIFPFTMEDFVAADIPLLNSLKKEIDTYTQKSGTSFHEILFRMYSLFTMIVSVSYSSIVDHFPNEDIDSLKPMIFTMIEKCFE